jgi:hypothetical protein
MIVEGGECLQPPGAATAVSDRRRSCRGAGRRGRPLEVASARCDGRHIWRPTPSLIVSLVVGLLRPENGISPIGGSGRSQIGGQRASSNEVLLLGGSLDVCRNGGKHCPCPGRLRVVSERFGAERNLGLRPAFGSTKAREGSRRSDEERGLQALTTNNQHRLRCVWFCERAAASEMAPAPLPPNSRTHDG